MIRKFFARAFGSGPVCVSFAWMHFPFYKEFGIDSGGFPAELLNF
jgi:hypothetical protein